ncbi:ALDH-like protein, partial [Trichoderma longibrachiatum ATCC 18648]
MERLVEQLVSLVGAVSARLGSQLDISPAAIHASIALVATLICGLIVRTASAAAIAATASRPRHYVVPPPAFPEKTKESSSSSAAVDGSSSTSIRIPGSSAIQCYAPATGHFLGAVEPATEADIDAAVAAAAEAQRAWATTTFDQRRAVLRSLMRHVMDNAEQICRVAGLDSGKTMVDAQLGEILVTVEKIQWTLAHGERALRPSRRPTNLLMAYKRNTVRYEPLGVVAALVSWNYPFHNLIGPVISALFAGDAIVVKVSEQTAWSSGYFLDIARGALAAHGHDPRLVQAVACWPETAGHLTSHRGISHIKGRHGRRQRLRSLLRRPAALWRRRRLRLRPLRRRGGAARPLQRQGHLRGPLRLARRQDRHPAARPVSRAESGPLLALHAGHRRVGVWDVGYKGCWPVQDLEEHV